jgi:hypothetical protein
VPSWTAPDSHALLAPGVVGLALALGAVRATASDATTIISIVVIGVVGSQFLRPAARVTETVE